MDNNNPSNTTSNHKPTRVIIWTMIIVLVCVAALFMLFVLEGVITITHPSSTIATHSRRPPASTHTLSSAPQTVFSQCQSQLTAQAKVGTSTIANNSILVVFATTTSYKQAQAVLAAVGASSTAAVTPSIFARNHLIQAAVLPAEEIFDICTLRATSTVHYAGFDQLFFLHP